MDGEPVISGVGVLISEAGVLEALRCCSSFVNESGLSLHRAQTGGSVTVIPRL